MATHKSWPGCTNCAGYGQIQGYGMQGGAGAGVEGNKGDQCPKCGGVGRVRPEGWVDSVVGPCESCAATGAIRSVKGTEDFIEEDGLSLEDALKASGWDRPARRRPY